MITEDYVSFEVAKLLKEKGFDEPCLMCYTYDEKLGNYGQYNSYKNSEVFSLTAPTLQMTLKWLREAHNLHINIFVTWKDKIPHYQWSIDNLITQDTTYDTPCLEKYEEACEAAIKYCLENLI